MILALDGGSTKTLAIIMNEKNLELIGVGLAGSANYTTNPRQLAQTEMKEAISGALKMGKVSLAEINDKVFALAGIGDSDQATNDGMDLVREIVGDNFEVINDGQSAYFLGNLKEDGFVFAPGTGSVGYVKNGSNMRRIGGWGWSIGDFSSATWIAKQGIESAMFEEDSMDHEKKISGMLSSYFGVNLRELIWKIESRAIPKSLLASFAPELAKIAKDGNQSSIDIFSRSADYISSISTEILNKLNGKNKLSIVGGTMRAGEFYTDMLKERIKQKFQTFFGYQVILGGLMNKICMLDENFRADLLSQLEELLKRLPQEKLHKYLYL